MALDAVLMTQECLALIFMSVLTLAHTKIAVRLHSTTCTFELSFLSAVLLMRS